MGRKQQRSGSGKKKGPRGKRARAKAKLDRRWGERVDDSEGEAERARRGRGRSRLLRKKPAPSDPVDPDWDPDRDPAVVEAAAAAAAAPPASAEGGGSDGGGPLKRRRAILANGGIAPSLSPNPPPSGGSSSSSSSSSSDADDDAAADGTGRGNTATVEGAAAGTVCPLDSLLRRIGGGGAARRRGGWGRPSSEESPKGRRRRPRRSIAGDDDDGAEGGEETPDAVDRAAEEDSTSDGEDDLGEQEGSPDGVYLGEDECEDEDEDGDCDGDGYGFGFGGGGGGGRGDDPYNVHFSRPPLPEDGDALSEALRPLRAARGISPEGTRHLNPSLDVHMSGDVLERWERERARDGDGGEGEGDPLPSLSAARARRFWERASSAPYRHVRRVLLSNWRRVNGKVLRADSDSNRDGDLGGGGGGGGERNMGCAVFSALQATLYPSLSSYADVLFTAESRRNRDAVENLLGLHVLNHVLTAMGRVRRHSRRIRDRELAEKDDAEADADAGADEDRWRDQGYTRPKVLVLLPTRETCLRFVMMMLRLLGNSAVVDQLDRFRAEYGAPPKDEDNEDDDDETSRRRKAVLRAKGEEWNDLFGDNINSDDEFRIGMALAPGLVNASKSKRGNNRTADADAKAKAKSKLKAAGSGSGSGSGSGNVSIRLYSKFYRSDIIVCSPLGLKMAASKGKGEDSNTHGDGGDGDGNVNGDKHGDGDADADANADVDFLSSIEVCLVARSDVLLMQNWDHVNSVLGFLNRQPTKNNDTDFSRVRNYLLAGQARNWRQLVIVSKFADPYILSAFKRHAHSVAGLIRVCRRVPPDEASVCDVLVRARQVFQRVPCSSVSTQGDDRLRYFVDRVLPQILRLGQGHTMIFVPSYFDFVAVRNVLLKREASFVSVTEYARVSEVSRGRARFHQGLKSLMLYTGRAHFFLRHRIRGARHIVFFGLPENAEFYPGLMNVLERGGLTAASGDGDAGGKGDGDGGALPDADADTPASCLALFTKYDARALERIVGTAHCERMVRGEKSTFLFCS